MKPLAVANLRDIRLVAPHRGAWVETLYLGRRGIGSRSRPIGARGLKRETTGSRLRSAAVAPPRGAGGVERHGGG